MTEESETETISRREKTVRLSKLNCIIGCIIIILNIVFICGAAWYIYDVRTNAERRVMQLQVELDVLRTSYDATTRFVYKTILPQFTEQKDDTDSLE